MSGSAVYTYAICFSVLITSCMTYMFAVYYQVMNQSVGYMLKDVSATEAFGPSYRLAFPNDRLAFMRSFLSNSA